MTELQAVQKCSRNASVLSLDIIHIIAMPEDGSLFRVSNTQMPGLLCRSPSKRRVNISMLSDQRRQAWQGISPHTIILSKRMMVKCERWVFFFFFIFSFWRQTRRNHLLDICRHVFYDRRNKGREREIIYSKIKH